ncbi:MAG: hypothetical protein WBM66_05490 [Thiothrix litoralis]
MLRDDFDEVKYKSLRSLEALDHHWSVRALERQIGKFYYIGLILCSQKSEAVLTDSAQLFAAKYLLYLPTEEELKRELEQERIKVQAQLQHNAHEEQP